jgi:putative membrane protein
MVTPDNLWRAWTWDPTVVLGITAASWAYLRGLGRLWGRAGIGHGVRRWQAAAFAGGILALIVALLSPLDSLDDALFSAHMVQHLLLILVAAPLLVLGAPLGPFLWALPASARRAIGQWWKRARGVRLAWHSISHPLVVWSLSVVAIWTWHVPSLYEAALRNEAVHAVEHASFLGTALLFWWIALDPRGQRRLGLGASVPYVFTMGLQMGILGAILSFAPTLWYPLQEADTAAWGLTPLGDQQLAGLVMWVPAGIIYLLAALALLARWLAVEEAATRRREMAGVPAPPSRLILGEEEE